MRPNDAGDRSDMLAASAFRGHFRLLNMRSSLVLAKKRETAPGSVLISSCGQIGHDFERRQQERPGTGFIIGDSTAPPKVGRIYNP